MKAQINLFFLFLTIIFINCNNDKSTSGIKKEENEKLILKNCKLDPVDNNFSFDSLFSGNSIKLIHYFNGDCPICIAEFGLLVEVLNRETNYPEILTLYIFSSNFLDQSIFNIEKVTYKGYVFYDSNGSFKRNNLFLEERGSNTCILNSKNKIIYIGNPILSNYSQNKFINHLKVAILLNN